MTGLIIGGCILFWLIVGLVIIIFNVSDSKSRLDTVNIAIEREIKDFLFNKNDINYIFKDKNLKQNMKSEIQTAIVDLRHNRYTLSKAYLHRSENKIKQIHRIINKYYKLDKKIIIEIINNEINNKEISWEQD